MKKLLALLLVLTLIFALVGCESKPVTKASDDGEDEATEVVENFMDALINFDFDSMKDYIDDPDALPDELQNLDVDTAVDTAMAELDDSFDIYRSDFEDLFEHLFDVVKSNMDYEITDVDEDDDDYVFTVEVAIPDFANIDFESMFANALSEDEMMALVTGWQEDGLLDYSSTEDDIMNLMIPEMFKKLHENIDTIDFNTITQEFELVVEEDDGDWIIDASKSDIGD